MDNVRWMSTAQAPAICDNCGTVFPSGFALGPGVSASMTGNTAGPCPNCQGSGTVPDGLYEFVGDTLNIITDLPPDRLRQVQDALTAARNATQPVAAVEEALKSEPAFAPILQRLSPLHDAAAFWAFVGTLVAAIMLLLALHGTGDTTTIEHQTVINQVITNCQPTVPGK